MTFSKGSKRAQYLARLKCLWPNGGVGKVAFDLWRTRRDRGSKIKLALRTASLCEGVRGDWLTVKLDGNTSNVRGGIEIYPVTGEIPFLPARNTHTLFCFPPSWRTAKPGLNKNRTIEGTTNIGYSQTLSIPSRVGFFLSRFSLQEHRLLELTADITGNSLNSSPVCSCFWVGPRSLIGLFPFEGMCFFVLPSTLPPPYTFVSRVADSFKTLQVAGCNQTVQIALLYFLCSE